jgi:hypothetical protein
VRAGACWWRIVPDRTSLGLRQISGSHYQPLLIFQIRLAPWTEIHPRYPS